MPVVDADGKVQGIITRKDIFENPGEEQVGWYDGTVATEPLQRSRYMEPGAVPVMATRELQGHASISLTGTVTEDDGTTPIPDATVDVRDDTTGDLIAWVSHDLQTPLASIRAVI